MWIITQKEIEGIQYTVYTTDQPMDITQFTIEIMEEIPLSPTECYVYMYRPTGKWYQTVVIDMKDYYDIDTGDLKSLVLECLNKQYKGDWSYYVLVCTKPYNKNIHPVMITPF